MNLSSLRERKPAIQWAALLILSCALIPLFAAAGLPAARALPRVLASILTLIAICAGIGCLLAAGAGVDPLTAYLATCPGGVDSVAIIAASSRVNVPFVVAMQTARFLVVLSIGPSLARFLARRAA